MKSKNEFQNSEKMKSRIQNLEFRKMKSKNEIQNSEIMKSRIQFQNSKINLKSRIQII